MAMKIPDITSSTIDTNAFVTAGRAFSSTPILRATLVELAEHFLGIKRLGSALAVMHLLTGIRY